MERLAQIKKLSEKDKVWDIVVVGGGATGLGVAVDAATRGMSVALLEKTDFAKCTSSRSTKLVHGGVRYLQKGDVMLVLEALRERGRMKANAPHLVKDQAFVISNYRYWDNFLYFCGLTFYDMLSFGFGYGRSKYISAKKVMKYIPTSVEKGLKGGVVYHDGQFDDSRMAVNLAQTCVENGGTVVNQATVTGIVHDAAGRAAGVKFVDNLTGEEHTLKARSVVNAAGCFVDDIMHMDSPTHRRMVTPSQGVHIVLDMKFLQSDYAIMVPKTSDGRVLFAVPWHDKVVVGTTDIVRPKAEEDPRPLKEEIDFILAPQKSLPGRRLRCADKGRQRNTRLAFQQPDCQSMCYLSFSANAVRQVIVDKSCRLQVGVTNRAAEEFESPFFHVFAHGIGLGRGYRNPR